ncbi:MAG: VirB4 family type IV secretion/conjugal transfer ATPase [Candidatus Saccharimonadales bacterium]
MFSALQDPRTVNPRDVLYDESQQADIESLGSALATLGDGQSLGEFSLSILLYDTDKAVMDRAVPDFARAFTTHDGSLHVETYNLLNAFFATVPGNYAFNLRRAMLLNSNYADLSFLFTIHPGEKHNPHLNAEYLAVLETDNATPYYLNLHNRDVAHALVLGYTGSGKSFLLNFRFLARKWESVRFTRLSEKRRIRFSWRLAVALSAAGS